MSALKPWMAALVWVACSSSSGIHAESLQPVSQYAATAQAIPDRHSNAEASHRQTIAAEADATPSQVPEAKLLPRGGFPAFQMQPSTERETDTGMLPSLTPTDEKSSAISAPLVTVCSSLAIVLALFAGLVWVSRRFGGGAAASKPLPASALSPLGHIMLDPRTKLLLVRCGRRVLVLSQTASGVTPITEVSHPDEVRELIASCSSEARQVFEKTLRQLEREPAQGFTDASPPPRKLFATA